MISITSESGSLLKVLNDVDGEETYGCHSVYGWTNESRAHQRMKARKRHGLRVAELNEGWKFNFRIKPSTKSAFEVVAGPGCKAEATADRRWKLATPAGVYFLSEAAVEPTIVAEPISKETFWRNATLAALLVAAAVVFIPMPTPDEAPVAVLEPQVVNIKMPEKQHTVRVAEPSLQAIPKELQNAKPEMKRAIQQNLGFMGLLGRKDLKKALGGMPIALKETSAGAGAGGTQGSGGETLVGLGEGVKRTTVGNTGVAGLGGIGTKGRGGGAGGYGDMMVGSGEGKGLTSLALSQDVTLEGGLDRSVIQATIAKYLSQVRACYEAGLRKNAGLMGQVAMAFEINGGGNLNYSKVARSSLGSPEVETCISEKMMGWKFPKPTGGVNVKVAYPFMLRPSAG
ncbi:MAG: AgmX/PglI C-terminal domain-containing protein [Bdellovibrionales bacterium]|nr:AgmX/PglI C-terminal domain-containing protein [Bdellovibrionales bacterium]